MERSSSVACRVLNSSCSKVWRNICLLLFILICQSNSKSTTKILSHRIKLTSTYHDNQEMVCNNRECIIAAAHIIQAMDERYNPCDDFAQFACDGWEKRNPVPDGRTRWTSVFKLNNKARTIVQSILEDEDQQTDSHFVNQARIFYRACVNETQLEIRGLKPLLNVFDENGGWPLIKANWREDSFNLKAEVVLKSFQVALTSRTNTKNKIQLSAYKTYMKTVVNILANNVSNPITNQSLINRDIEDVEKFENEVNTILEPFSKYDELSLTDIKNNLFNNTNKRIIANAYQWQLVKSVGSETTKAMRDAKAQYNKIAKGKKYKKSRTVSCIKRVTGHMSSLGMAIGTEYIENYFTKSNKRNIITMIENIRTSFNDMLLEKEWLINEIKSLIVERASSISSKVGYPDWYDTSDGLQNYYANLGPMIEEEHFKNVLTMKSFFEQFESIYKESESNNSLWLLPPITVNALYSPYFNTIEFPAAILQPPFYGAAVPQYLNYGGIGTVIGHEMNHGYHYIAASINPDEKADNVTWWTDEVGEKVHCFIDQYNDFRIPELETETKNVTVNGEQTLKENMSDNGGINAAFHAYKKIVKEHGREPKLPGLLKYSPDQLFFISSAQTRCSSMTKEGLENQLSHQIHSPARYRIIGPMSNMEAFSEIWNCPLGSVMNPEDKCRVW